MGCVREASGVRSGEETAAEVTGPACLVWDTRRGEAAETASETRSAQRTSATNCCELRNGRFEHPRLPYKSTDVGPHSHTTSSTESSHKCEVTTDTTFTYHRTSVKSYSFTRKVDVLEVEQSTGDQTETPHKSQLSLHVGFARFVRCGGGLLRLSVVARPCSRLCSVPVVVSSPLHVRARARSLACTPLGRVCGYLVGCSTGAGNTLSPLFFLAAICTAASAAFDARTVRALTMPSSEAIASHVLLAWT